MLELVMLAIVVLVVSLSLVPWIISIVKNSKNFLKSSLFTLALLFTILTVISEVINYALTVYHTQSYKTMITYATNGMPSPVSRAHRYASANKMWVAIMIVLFVILLLLFANKQ